MTIRKRFAVGMAAAALSIAAAPALAQENGDAKPDSDEVFTTSEEVRTEVSEAMDAIARYSAQQRDQALAEAEEALDRLDAEIARLEESLRDNWAEMSAAAKDESREQLQNLREARNELGERYGALEAGAKSAWDDLKSGFTSAWESFSETWQQSEEDKKDQ